MKSAHAVKRSRNARLNQAIRHAQEIVSSVQEFRTTDDPTMFADLRESAFDLLQAVHEASAYDNVYRDGQET